MDVASAKMLGAGIAMIALAGVGIGMGTIFGSLVNSVARNPASRDRVFGLAILGRRRAFDLEAKGDRFLYANHQLVERLGLRMAAAQFRHGSHVVAVRILLDNDIEFFNHGSFYNAELELWTAPRQSVQRMSGSARSAACAASYFSREGHVNVTLTDT